MALPSVLSQQPCVIRTWYLLGGRANGGSIAQLRSGLTADHPFNSFRAQTGTELSHPTRPTTALTHVRVIARLHTTIRLAHL